MTRKTPNRDPRDKLIQVRVSQEELDRINEAADRAGLDRSAFMRHAAITTVIRLKSKHEDG
jgi:uncharacterized protein (DUF1778 family)